MLSNFGYLYSLTKDRTWINRGKALLAAVRQNMTSGGILAESCDAGGSCSNDNVSDHMTGKSTTS